MRRFIRRVAFSPCRDRAGIRKRRITSGNQWFRARTKNAAARFAMHFASRGAGFVAGRNGVELLWSDFPRDGTGQSGVVADSIRPATAQNAKLALGNPCRLQETGPRSAGRNWRNVPYFLGIRTVLSPAQCKLRVFRAGAQRVTPPLQKQTDVMNATPH